MQEAERGLPAPGVGEVEALEVVPQGAAGGDAERLGGVDGVPRLGPALPTGLEVVVGLAELAAGTISAESLAISIAMPRLRRDGLPSLPPHPDPEDRLYELLSRRSDDLAHERYNAYLRQVASFAAACRLRRLKRTLRAS